MICPTLSALRLASLACCSQASALSMALSFSSFMACIFFLMASMVIRVLVTGYWKKGKETKVSCFPGKPLFWSSLREHHLLTTFQSIKKISSQTISEMHSCATGQVRSSFLNLKFRGKKETRISKGKSTRSERTQRCGLAPHSSRRSLSLLFRTHVHKGRARHASWVPP